MNERIEHCLYQAGLTASGCWDELGIYEQEAIEKFAELIVKECIDKAEAYGLGCDAVEQLKEDFGVEE